MPLFLFRGGVSFSATTSSSTCYDVVQAVKDYLKRTGNEDKSICEVLQARGSPHVGPADVFVSHVQGTHVASMLGTIKDAPVLFGDVCHTGTKYWIDITSLRQCQQNAFVPEEIVGVIKGIKACLVEIDLLSSYLSRIFCIFEVFGAVLNKVPLLCAPKAVMEEVRDSQRWDALLVLSRGVSKLDCATAKSRSEKDTRAISKYIERTVGFKFLNDAVKSGILVGMDRTRPGAPGIKTVDASE